MNAVIGHPRNMQALESLEANVLLTFKRGISLITVSDPYPRAGSSADAGRTQLRDIKRTMDRQSTVGVGGHPSTCKGSLMTSLRKVFQRASFESGHGLMAASGAITSPLWAVGTTWRSKRPADRRFRPIATSSKCSRR